MAVRDVVFAAVILFTIGIGFLILNYAANTIFNSIVGVSQVNESAHAVAVFKGTQTNVVDRLDYLFMGLFVALCLGIVITGWFIAGEPIFVFVYMLVWIIGVVFSSVLAYVWDTVKVQGVFVTAQTLTHFPYTNHILSLLPMYIAIMGFIGLVILFAKPQR